MRSILDTRKVNCQFKTKQVYIFCKIYKNIVNIFKIGDLSSHIGGGLEKKLIISGKLSTKWKLLSKAPMKTFNKI